MTIAAGKVKEERAEGVRRRGLALGDGPGVGQRLGKVRHGCLKVSGSTAGNSHLREMVRGLAHERVDKVGTTKRAGDERVDIATVRGTDLDVAANVGEDVLVTHRDESWGW